MREEEQKTFVTAVDFGSSALRAAAATQNEDGTLHILGVEEIAKKGYIKSGMITNSTDASMQLGRILLLLTNRVHTQREIQATFVSIGGRLLQVKTVPVKRNLLTKSYITKRLLEDMQKESIEKISESYPDMTGFNSEPIQYILDDVAQSEVPSSTQKAQMLQTDYNVFFIKKETWDKLKGSFDRACKDIKYCWAKPIPQMTALLSETDSEEGCAIIAFGAQTTTLSIYGNNYCQFVKMVPFGGDHITKDLQSLKISFDTAEKLKRGFGYASPRYIKNVQCLRMQSTDPDNPTITIDNTLIAHVIKARLDEIVQPILTEIEKSRDKIGHIYITGGGTMLKGLIPYLKEKTGIATDFGSHADWLDESTDKEYYKPKYATLIGTLALAIDYQKNHSESLTESPIGKKKLSEKLKDKILDIFTE